MSLSEWSCMVKLAESSSPEESENSVSSFFWNKTVNALEQNSGYVPKLVEQNNFKEQNIF